MNQATDLDIRMTDDYMYLRINTEGEQAFEMTLGDENWHLLSPEIQDEQIAVAMKKLTELNEQVGEQILALTADTQSVLEHRLGELDLDFLTPERDEPDLFELSRPGDGPDRTDSGLEHSWSPDNPFAPDQQPGLPEMGCELLPWDASR